MIASARTIRKRQVARALALGETTKRTARRFRLSASAMFGEGGENAFVRR